MTQYGHRPKHWHRAQSNSEFHMDIGPNFSIGTQFDIGPKFGIQLQNRRRASNR